MPPDIRQRLTSVIIFRLLLLNTGILFIFFFVFSCSFINEFSPEVEELLHEAGEDAHCIKLELFSRVYKSSKLFFHFLWFFIVEGFFIIYPFFQLIVKFLELLFIEDTSYRSVLHVQSLLKEDLLHRCG
jgi:hypothetical protein